MRLAAWCEKGNRNLYFVRVVDFVDPTRVVQDNIPSEKLGRRRQENPAASVGASEEGQEEGTKNATENRQTSKIGYPWTTEEKA